MRLMTGDKLYHPSLCLVLEIVVIRVGCLQWIYRNVTRVNALARMVGVMTG